MRGPQTSNRPRAKKPEDGRVRNQGDASRVRSQTSPNFLAQFGQQAGANLDFVILAARRQAHRNAGHSVDCTVFTVNHVKRRVGLDSVSTECLRVLRASVVIFLLPEFHHEDTEDTEESLKFSNRSVQNQVESAWHWPFQLIVVSGFHSAGSLNSLKTPRRGRLPGPRHRKVR